MAKTPSPSSFRITNPAIVTLVGYALLVLLVLLPVDMYTYDEDTHAYVKQKYDFMQRLLLVLLLSFPFILSIYSVNCMMVGSCKWWSWIVAIVTIVWAMLVLATTFATRSFTLDTLLG